MASKKVGEEGGLEVRVDEDVLLVKGDHDPRFRVLYIEEARRLAALLLDAADAAEGVPVGVHFTNDTRAAVCGSLGGRLSLFAASTTCRFCLATLTGKKAA